MPDGLALSLALVALAGALATAVMRPPRLSEAIVATGGAVVLVLAGVTGAREAGDAIRELGPTVGFLAALLLIAEGCRRDGLFDAIGAVMARGSRGSPRRLLAFVFATAAAVTAVLSLDATVVLLTPIVFATAVRMRVSPKPHIYACSHLANSASLLLPMSNLTNLLAFHASDLSFTRFAALMALPTIAAVGVEWIVSKRFFATDLRRPQRAGPTPAPPRLPRFALTVVGLTLAGFVVSSVVAIEPVWIAVAGAVVMTVPAVAAGERSGDERAARGGSTPLRLVRAVEPGFLVFVLALGVIVQAAADNGLESAVRAVLPGGRSLPDLLAIAALGAVLANLVNNLPATLMLVPVAAAGGHGPVLATLIGVNVGPNLTYAGSLATLLWRRVLHREDTAVELREFVRLGALTVPATLVAATVALWLALQA